jgi:hypothetical protein
VEQQVTIDDLKALAKKAKAWRPTPHEAFSGGVPMAHENGIDASTCDRCLGAVWAADDIEDEVDFSMAGVITYSVEPGPRSRHMGLDGARDARHIAAYFGPRDNPVEEFASGVEAFLRIPT